VRIGFGWNMLDGSLVDVDCIGVVCAGPKLLLASPQTYSYNEYKIYKHH